MIPLALQDLFDKLVWLQPGWLWLILPALILPVLLPRFGFLFSVQCLLGKGLEIRVPSQALGAAEMDSTQSAPASQVIPVLTGLILALVCLALAQPVKQGGVLERAEQSEPVDAWLLASTAVSTVLKDYRIDGQAVDRMTLARLIMDRFARDFAGKNMGLILLGRPPVLWLPLSPDRNLVRDHIQRIQTTLAGRNSALGDGLALLAKTEQQASRDRSTEDPSTEDRIAIVITDAALELGRHSPEQGLALAREGGFTVYFIVLGAEARDGADRYQGKGLLYRPADLAAIRTLVGAGHPNQVFHATRVEVVDQALETIQSRHRKPVSPVEDQYRQQPLYSIPLMMALFLLLLIPILGARR